MAAPHVDAPPATTAWHGPGARRRRRTEGPPPARRGGGPWRRLLWSLLYPPRGHRITPTAAGVVLIALALGLGMAAYNTANNILFITLSLLLACLILSGVLSWLNLAGVAWRLSAKPPFRAGQAGVAALELRNGKRLVPTYGLWFEVRHPSAAAPVRLTLHERLEPRGDLVRLEWMLVPARRGIERIEAVAVGSLFPFGFLRKTMGLDLRAEVLVWPAPVPFQWLGVAARWRPRAETPVARVGHSGDLLALRDYAAGDALRLVHWKATARLGRLMVRQFASEGQEGFSLWFETAAGRWPRAEQFELACSLVVSLAEDLFTRGQLRTVAIDADAPTAVRHLRDLEAFFDRIARLPAAPAAGDGAAGVAGPARGPVGRIQRHLLTFAPDGPRGAAAYLDGEKAATA